MTIKIKLFSIVFAIVSVSIIVLAIQSIKTIEDITNQNIKQYESQVLNAKKESLKNYIDMAKGILKIYQEKVTKDTTKEELEKIKKDAIKAMDSMSYGDDGYVFVWSYDGVPLAFHPRPDLIGKTLLNLKGGGGKWVIKDHIANAKKGGGHFYTYKWKTTKDSPYQTKISYSFGLEDWRWFVGTGEYMSNEEKMVANKKQQFENNKNKLIKNIIVNVLIVMLIMGIIFYFILQKMIIKPLNLLQDGLSNFFLFLQNKIENVESIELNSTDEFGTMTSKINDNIKVSSKLHNQIYELNKNLENKIDERTKELEKQKDEFEAIYNGSKDAIAILDMKSNFLQINPAYIEMTGFTKEELLATSCFNLTVPKDIEPSKDAMQEVLKVGYIKNFEKQCKIKNDKFITMNISMSLLKNPDRILISVRDITQIEEAKKKVEKERENFEFLFNNTIEAIGLFKEYKFIDINEAAIKLFGFHSKEEALGKHTLSVVAPESIELAKSQLGKVIDTPYELMAQKINGEKFPALVRGLTAVVNGEEIRVTTLIDISDLKNKEKELELAKDKAEENTKLKSEFLANMSHEIRTPMNGIIGMTHLAQKTNLDDKQKKYIETINQSSNALLNIINDILDFSKIEAGKLNIDKVDFRLDELLLSVSSLVEFKAQEKDLEFNIKYSDDLPLNLYGDSLRISQVLINLLNNAVKFTNSGYVNVTIENSGDDFIFKVYDSGIGMNKEQQSKLFEAFSQADGSTTRKYGGTGLGLSISKQLVELMGGKIWVESHENKGSIFSFNLKLPKAINEIKIIKQEKQNINTLKDSQILLVEDNTTNQEIIIGLLENSGINIDIANNGQEAVELYKTNPTKYELILMDLQMPIMGGLEATEIIRKENTNIPIVALTANARKEDI